MTDFNRLFNVLTLVLASAQSLYLNDLQWKVYCVTLMTRFTSLYKNLKFGQLFHIIDKQPAFILMHTENRSDKHVSVRLRIV